MNFKNRCEQLFCTIVLNEFGSNDMRTKQKYFVILNIELSEGVVGPEKGRWDAACAAGSHGRWKCRW